MSKNNVALRHFLDEILEEKRVEAKADLGILALQDHPQYQAALESSQDAADHWLSYAINDSNVRSFALCVGATTKALREVVLSQGDESIVQLIDNPSVANVFPHDPNQRFSSRRCAVFQPISDNNGNNIAFQELFGNDGRYALQAVVLEDAVRDGSHTVKLQLLLQQSRSLLAVRYTYVTIETTGIATWTPFETRLVAAQVRRKAMLLPAEPLIEHTSGVPYRNVAPFHQDASRSRYGHLGIGKDVSRLATHLESLALAIEGQMRL